MAAFRASFKGYIAYAAGNYSDAILHYTEAINLAPNNATYYLNRFSSYYDTHQYYNAILDAKKAINLSPNSCLGYKYLGEAYTALKQYDDAVLTYKKGLEVDPYNSELKCALAYVNMKNEDWNSSLVVSKPTLLKEVINRQNVILDYLSKLSDNVNGYSVETALSVLNRMVDDRLIEKGGELWCVATDLFEDVEKREIFIRMPDDDGRIAWLKHNNITKKNNIIDQDLMQKKLPKEEPKEESDHDDIYGPDSAYFNRNSFH